jgi:hypothetical protein
MNIDAFKTQKALKEYICDTINNIGLCDSVKNNYPNEYIMFLKLFERHPNYPEKIIGIIDIQIKNNPIYKKNKELIIIKNDNTSDNISYNQCIAKRKNNNLKVAMRCAIEDQIITFRNENNKICVLCDSTKDLQVDHIIWFEKLYDDFITICNDLNYIIPTVFDSNAGNLKCFKTGDTKFENEWKNFHKDNASLRILCKSCNLTRPKYKNT